MGIEPARDISQAKTGFELLEVHLQRRHVRIQSTL